MTPTTKGNKMKASSRVNDKRPDAKSREAQKRNVTRHHDPELGPEKCYCAYCRKVCYFVSRSAITAWQARMADTLNISDAAAGGMYPAECTTCDRIDPDGPYRIVNIAPAHKHCNTDAGAVAWADRFAHDPELGAAIADHAAAYRPRRPGRK